MQFSIEPEVQYAASAEHAVSLTCNTCAGKGRAVDVIYSQVNTINIRYRQMCYEYIMQMGLCNEMFKKYEHNVQTDMFLLIMYIYFSCIFALLSDYISVYDGHIF